MTLHPRLTRATIALVTRFETFQPVAEPTPDGRWSIGYGHTRSARKGARVDVADAEALLTYDLNAAARAVERALFAPVTQRQFEALTALCFNVGEQAFQRSSALARVNAGAELDAADEIERWRQAELGAGTQVVDALVRRRAAEKAHFLGLPDGEAKWPSAQLRPLAVPGGESPEPAVAVECPSSAALAAANGVQARLRRLIPDEEGSYGQFPTPFSNPPATAAPEPEAFDPPPETSPPESAPDDAAAPEIEHAGAWEEPSEPPSAWDPPAPPFDPPAPDQAPVQQPRPAAPPDVPRPSAASPVASAPARAPGRPRARRLAYALLGLLGATLFLAAVGLILTGRPGLLDLGLGVAGVLLAAPALYGLLGSSKRAEARDSASAPFHNGPAHTK